MSPFNNYLLVFYVSSNFWRYFSFNFLNDHTFRIFISLAVSTHIQTLWRNTRTHPLTNRQTVGGLCPPSVAVTWLTWSAPAVPGAPPSNVKGEAISATAIRVSWDPPRANRSHGNIIYYKLRFVEADRSDSEAATITLNGTTFVLDELKRWMKYRIWVMAGTSVGDGPASYPITIQTLEDGTCLDHGFKQFEATKMKIFFFQKRGREIWEFFWTFSFQP